MWDNFLQNPMALDMLKLSAPQMMPGAPTTTVPNQTAGAGINPAMFSMLARYGMPNTKSAQPMMQPPTGPAPSAPAPTGTFGQASPYALPPAQVAAPAQPSASGALPMTMDNMRKYGLAGIFNQNGSMG